MTKHKKILDGHNTAVLVATFSPWLKGKRLPTNGSVEPLRDFFVPKIRKFVLIDQVSPGSETVIPRVEIYERQKKMKISKLGFWIYLLWPFLKLVNYNATHISFKIRDFLSVFDIAMRDNTIYDFFIGMESINAIAGVVLRKFGRVRKVIYYVSDYSPNRYKINWFNKLYLWLDRYAATHSDYIWDVSKAMQPARIKAGLDVRKSAPEIHVPNGLYPNQIKAAHLTKVIPYSLVYMGTLGSENGPDLAIEALSEICQRYPKTTLRIIGGRQSEIESLKTFAQKLKVIKKIKFYGFVPSAFEMSRLIRECYVALAPYRSIPGSPRYFADAGKIRVYCAAGVPVVTTDVPPLGKEALVKGAAIIVKDDAKKLAQAVMELFSNHKHYLQLKQSAIRFAKDNTWENTFSQAFKTMQYYGRNSPK